MADFQLNENDSMGSIRSLRPKKTPKGITQKLISWGLAKDEAQAKLYMIALIVIGFAVIIYININTFSSPAPADPISGATMTP